MKKILIILISLILFACEPSVLSEEFYYYNLRQYYPVVYVKDSPYYRVYINNRYYYKPVPRQDHGYIYRRPPGVDMRTHNHYYHRH